MFAKGYRPDPPHRRTQRDARNLLGSFVAAPDRDLSSFEAPIFQQLGYSACFGHGTAQGIVVAMGAAGTPLGFVPSPLGIYTVTRCIDRGSAVGVPLTDSGSIPSDGMQGISQWGVRPIGALNPSGNTDCTDALINREPALGELERDAVSLIVGEYRLDETSSDLVPTARGLIAKGVPIGIGCYVGPEFEGWNSAAAFAPVNVGDPNHWMLVVASRTEADGSTSFKICNSWGAWCQQGHIWVASSFLAAPNTSDLYAFTVRQVTS
jgi:hypothetical protein